MTIQETKQATTMQPLDLKALAAQVIKRNQCNRNGNSFATQSILSSCQVSSPKESNQATLELKQLTYKISQYYGGDDEQFLSEYIEDILKYNDIDKALTCFRNLAKQLISAINRK